MMMEASSDAAAAVGDQQNVEELYQFLATTLGDVTIEDLKTKRTVKHTASPTVEDWKRNLAPHFDSFINPQPILCKNLFLKDAKKNSVWLVTASIETEIKLNNLSKFLGFRALRFAKEELLHELLRVKQ